MLISKILMRGVVLLLTFASTAAYSAYEITALFSGRVTQYHDFYTGTADPSKSGQLFTGSVTFDIDFPPIVESLPGRSSISVQSESGCMVWINNVCDAGAPFMRPVVTSYRLDSPSGRFYDTQIPISPLSYQFSRASATEEILPAGDVERSLYLRSYSSETVITGDRLVTIDQTVKQQILELFPSVTSETFLGSFAWLNELLSAGVFDVPVGQENFYFLDSLYSETCSPYPCAGGYSPQSYEFFGSLTSLQFVQGSVPVPEPISIALVALGVAGLALRRRK